MDVRRPLSAAGEDEPSDHPSPCGAASPGKFIRHASAVKGTSSVGFPGIAATISAVSWFLLGFFFFAFLYAAAGSLVFRPEELQSVVTPIMLITMLPAGVAFVAAQDLSVTWVGVLRYIPPFSCLLMPMLAAVHEVGSWQQAAAAALSWRQALAS